MIWAKSLNIVEHNEKSESVRVVNRIKKKEKTKWRRIISISKSVSKNEGEASLKFYLLIKKNPWQI